MRDKLIPIGASGKPGHNPVGVGELAVVSPRVAEYSNPGLQEPPFAYHWGRKAARAHLKALGAPEPSDLPPYDESKHEPMPEVEIDPPDLPVKSGEELAPRLKEAERLAKGARLLAKEAELVVTNDELVVTDDKLLAMDDELVVTDDELVVTDDKLLAMDDKLLAKGDERLAMHDAFLAKADELLAKDDDFLAKGAR